MKILFLSEEFPPAIQGGSAIVVYNLANELKNRGHDVFVITAVSNKLDPGEEIFKGIKVFRVYANYHPRWQAWLSLYNPKNVRQVEKIIKEIKPDIIHAHNIHYLLSYHCLKVAKKYAQAVFLTVHDVMLFNYGKFFPKKRDFIVKVNILEQIKSARKRYNPWRNLMIRHYLKYADKIFAVSDSLKEFLAANKIKNAVTIYNGLRVEDWQIESAAVKQFKEKHKLANPPAGGKKVIFFGGRLSGAKGGDQLLHALALVKKELADFVLLVAGEENDYTGRMKNLVKELGLADQVIFTGWLGQEVKAAYHSSDLIVSPSLCFESFGMVNLEAMACRRPVISSYFGGPSEVVADNQTGYLINPYQIETLAEKIVDLLKNKDKAEKFGQAGYQKTRECFSLEKQVNKTLDYYHQYV